MPKGHAQTFANVIRQVDVRPGDCWIWRGALTRGGYGKVNWNGRQNRVHRAIYEVLIGPIPDGMELDHLCRVELCVNPSHLEPVNPAENRRRQGAAVTHCPAGHEYDEANTYIVPKTGHRHCRACNRRRRHKR